MSNVRNALLNNTTTIQYLNSLVKCAILFNICEKLILISSGKRQSNTWRKYCRQWWTEKILLCMFYHHPSRIENSLLLYRLIKNGFKLIRILRRNFQVSPNIRPSKCFSLALVSCGVRKWHICMPSLDIWLIHTLPTNSGIFSAIYIFKMSCTTLVLERSVQLRISSNSIEHLIVNQVKVIAE